MTFLIRRTAASLVQLLCVSICAFLLFRLLPGDIYAVQLENPQLSRASVEAMREARGLHQSWTVRYLGWLKSSAHGDFGVSLAYGIPVGNLIAPRLRRTLVIAVPALGLAWVLGIGAALFAVRLPLAPAFTPGVAVASMVPDVVAISLLLWLAVWAGLSITRLWLPVGGLTLAIAPVVFLHASAEFRAAQELEFVRIAKSRGISGSRLWMRFVLPASANPLISLAGLSVSAAIGSSFVVEVLTGWPGLGPLFLEAVQARDYPIVQTIVVLLAAVLTLSNLVADLLLYRLDPRIRISHEH